MGLSERIYKDESFLQNDIFNWTILQGKQIKFRLHFSNLIQKAPNI